MKPQAIVSDVSSDGSLTYHVEDVLTIQVDCGAITFVDIETPMSANQLKNHLNAVRTHVASSVSTF